MSDTIRMDRRDRAHPLLVLAIVFMAACAEAIALIGTVVPAGAVMFAAGALIGAGALDAWTTIGVAAVGAVIGDGISYELGRHYRGVIRNAWARFGYAAAFARGEEFVLRHGMKSIVLARFLAPVRAVVPVVVGCATLPRRSFYPVNVVSALIWAPVHVAPGILFGASAALAAAISDAVAVILLVVAALVALVWDRRAGRVAARLAAVAPCARRRLARLRAALAALRCTAARRDCLCAACPARCRCSLLLFIGACGCSRASCRMSSRTIR